MTAPPAKPPSWSTCCCTFLAEPDRSRRVERRPVIYVALEGIGGIDNRFVAAAQELGVEDQDLALAISDQLDNFREPAAVDKVIAIAKDLMTEFQFPPSAAPVVSSIPSPPRSEPPGPLKPGEHFIPRSEYQKAARLWLHRHFHPPQRQGCHPRRPRLVRFSAAIDFEFEIERDDELRTSRITKARATAPFIPSQPSATSFMASCSDKTNTAKRSPPSPYVISPTRTGNAPPGNTARRLAPRSTACGR